MDGLATSLALCATTTFMIIAWYFNHLIVLVVLAALLGSLCAFMWYNKPPARIYLGDTGSLFIGGFFATIPFLFDWGTYNKYGFLTPLIILAIPLLEGVSLILIRLYKGIPFYKASADHFSYYLLGNGWGKGIFLYMSFLCLILCLNSVLFVMGVVPAGLTIASGVLFLLVWIACLIKKKV